MSWRTAATLLIVIFALILVWTTMADPLIQVGNEFKDLETSGQFNTDQKIDSNINAVFNMILVAIFGLLGWGTWRVLRNELTRGRL